MSTISTNIWQELGIHIITMFFAFKRKRYIFCFQTKKVHILHLNKKIHIFERKKVSILPSHKKVHILLSNKKGTYFSFKRKKVYILLSQKGTYSALKQKRYKSGKWRYTNNNTEITTFDEVRRCSYIQEARCVEDTQAPRYKAPISFITTNMFRILFTI